jgi:hypothetical protein
LLSASLVRRALGKVEGLDVVAPDVTGDPVAYGLAVRVGREVGDALPGVGRGETVAAGDALAVCAEIGTIAPSRTTSMAPSKSNVFISNRVFGSIY